MFSIGLSHLQSTMDWTTCGCNGQQSDDHAKLLHQPLVYKIVSASLLHKHAARQSSPLRPSSAVTAVMIMQVKEATNRMLTNFSVQASVNDFFTAQRIFKESGTKALPQVS